MGVLARAAAGSVSILAVTSLWTGPAISSAATVLTLEGGFVGMQNLIRTTPQQLQGKLCTTPNTCQPVDYFALPVGSNTIRGGQLTTEAIDDLPAGTPVVLLGHSQGGQVIYSALRDWKSGAQPGPDPAQVTWISLGNPENKYGRQAGGIGYTNGQGVPADTPYTGYEVIRQYDGWADWPDDTSNWLAVANATVGMFTIHNDYKDIDPTNNFAAYGSTSIKEGNITYVWVPTDTVPLAAWAGPFAPALDDMLRPTIEKAYSRPVSIPDPTPPATTATVQTSGTVGVEALRDNTIDTHPAASTNSTKQISKDAPASTAKLSQKLAQITEQATQRAEKRKQRTHDTLNKVATSVKQTVQKVLGKATPSGPAKSVDNDDADS